MPGESIPEVIFGGRGSPDQGNPFEGSQAHFKNLKCAYRPSKGPGHEQPPIVISRALPRGELPQFNDLVSTWDPPLSQVAHTLSKDVRRRFVSCTSRPEFRLSAALAGPHQTPARGRTIQRRPARTCVVPPRLSCPRGLSCHTPISTHHLHSQQLVGMFPLRPVRCQQSFLQTTLNRFSCLPALRSRHRQRRWPHAFPCPPIWPLQKPRQPQNGR